MAHISAENVRKVLKSQIDFSNDMAEFVTDLFHSTEVNIRLARRSKDFSDSRTLRITMLHLNNPLEVIRETFLTLIDYTAAAYSPMNKWGYYTFDLNDYWLNKIFEVDILASDKKRSPTSRVVQLVDRSTRDKHIICFSFDKRENGWRATDPKIGGFSKLLENIWYISALSVIREDGFCLEPTGNRETGVITVRDHMNYGGGMLQITKVLKATKDTVELEYTKVTYPKNPSTQEFKKYIFKLEEGKLIREIQDMGVPSWFEKSTDGSDLMKHPGNTYMHHLLPDYTDPIFEGNHLYVAFTKDIFVRFGSSWIKVDKNWIASRIHEYPDLSREWLAIQMAELL